MIELNHQSTSQVSGGGILAMAAYGTVGFWTGLIGGGICTLGIAAIPCGLAGGAIGLYYGMDSTTPHITYITVSKDGSVLDVSSVPKV